MNKKLKRNLLCVLYYGIAFLLIRFLRKESLLDISPFSLLGIEVATFIPIIIILCRHMYDLSELLLQLIYLFAVTYFNAYFIIFLYPDTSLPFHSYSKVKLVLLYCAAFLVCGLIALVLSFIINAILEIFIRLVFCFFKKDSNETNIAAKTVVHNEQDDENDDYDKIVDTPIYPPKD